MTASQLVPALLVPFIAWRIYSRVRRTIGRQPYRPGRLLGTVIFFSVMMALFALAAATHPPALAALGGGLLIAAGLGFIGLRLTTWEHTADGEFYVPNRVIGLAVTLLFLGRIAYRVATISAMSADGPPPTMFQSPLTLGIFGVTAGYYIAYYLGLYLRGRHELAAVAKKNSSPEAQH